MSFKILYKGSNVRFAFSLNKHQMLGVCAIAMGLTFWIGRTTAPSDTDDITRVLQSQSGLKQQQQDVEQLKLQTQEQLTGMVMKLGDMQGQLRRLDALSERLAESSHLSVEEFAFNEQPAIGGPSQAAPNYIVKDSAELMAGIDNMLGEIKDKSRQLEALESIMLSHHVNDQSYLAGRPIKSGWLSSFYGIRKDPFNGLPAMHKGLDFAGKEGSDVIATGAGVVTWAGERYGYGNLVEVDHGDGLSTRYGHNKAIKVKVGDVVTKGQVLGLMGKTGRATGAHVHYEVLRNGRQLDPLAYVSRRNRH
ncbi:M23 family metallopeptidase [Neptunicella marina]|uniref:Peptidoglycan DD-metalloendopeptidase family protein n=1 Tax=Neptunicella marina TaxID=2125989 RepID=A0A8J6LYE0_9ALTE|nr:M23 family metallopeptidase [Neptunicella marina]MBC3765305.1 peptidoglycan DD-metalloendopeptidase family protein [Neptunicella marina]